MMKKQRLSNEGQERINRRNFQQQYNISKDASIQFDIVFDFEVCIEIGDGRSQNIYMNQKSDSHEVALKFCEKYKLEKAIVELLAQSLAQQSAKQKEAVRHLHQIQQQHQLIHTDSKLVGADKILSQSRKLYSWKKGSQEIWKERSQPMGYPKINDVSKQIVNKIGKQTIIDYMAKRSEDKIYQHVLDKIDNDARQYQNYSFHPTINPISQEVDKTLRTISHGQRSRFNQLYDYHKLYEHKIQEKRKNSLNQLSFKPQTNNLSKQIMNRKQSQNCINSATKHILKSGQFCHQKINNSFDLSNKYKQHKRNQCSEQKNRKPYRGKSSELGKNLYEDAKRRQEKNKRNQIKFAETITKENWRIIEQSNEMAINQREEKIRQIFFSLTNRSNPLLKVENIIEEDLTDNQKIFLPIFKEMKELDTSLNVQQFLQAGIRLLDYLSPLQRALLVRKSSKPHTHDKENNQNHQMNSKSQSIVKQKGYGSNFSIYTRGLVYKREIKDQVEKKREEKVRKQLINCTFQPKVSNLPNSYAY